MSHLDYEQSREVAFGAAAPSTPALVMALLRRGAVPEDLAVAYPEVVAEFRYRYWSGGGWMPGEPGYNPTTDDNLRPTDGEG